MFSSLKNSLTVFRIQCIADLGDHLSIIILTVFVELHCQMLHGEFPNQKTSVSLEDFLKDFAVCNYGSHLVIWTDISNCNVASDWPNVWAGLPR